MPWKEHRESGEAVRSIRDWGWMQDNTRDDGKYELSYGDSGTKGHHVENADGSLSYSRDTNGTVLYDDSE